MVLQQLWSSSAIVIARCHTQIFVSVVTYVSAHHLLSRYYLSTYSYKCMSLITRFCGTCGTRAHQHYMWHELQ